MFVCRACKGEQTRAFSSMRTLFAAPATTTTTTTTQGASRHRALSRPRDSKSSGQSSAIRGHNAAIQVLSLGSKGGPRKQSTRNQIRNQESAEQKGYRADMERQMGRPWREGDVYAPHDLSAAEMQKWKKPASLGRPTRDICDTLGINPLHHYKNFSIMSEYMTDMGRIKSGRENGLRPINQRKMSRAIRRAVSCGLMPSTHKHPEILRTAYENDLGRQ